MKLSYSNVLLIAGTGRNSGKTTVACELIRWFSRKNSVFALKISSHVHEPSENTVLLFEDISFRIFEEKSTDLQKDSSRMLACGALKSFYIESKDQTVDVAFQRLLDFIPENSPIICESPALHEFIHPGIFIITDNDNVVSRKVNIQNSFNEANVVVNVFHDYVEPLISAISFCKGEWKMKTQ